MIVIWTKGEICHIFILICIVTDGRRQGSTSGTCSCTLFQVKWDVSTKVCRNKCTHWFIHLKKTVRTFLPSFGHTPSFTLKVAQSFICETSAAYSLASKHCVYIPQLLTLTVAILFTCILRDLCIMYPCVLVHLYPEVLGFSSEFCSILTVCILHSDIVLPFPSIHNNPITFMFSARKFSGIDLVSLSSFFSSCLQS